MKTIILVFFISSVFHSIQADEIKKVLRFGYYLPSLSDTDPKDIRISLNFWAKEIGETSQINLKSFFYKDVKKLEQDLEAKKLDVITASTLVLAKDFKPDTFGEGFRAVGRNPKSQNRLLLLVREGSHFKSLKALRHKSIARIKNSDMEALYLNIQLRQKFHQDAKDFFKKNLFLKSYAKAILKLFFKKTDAALVTQEAYELAAELNPQIRKRLKVIAKYNVNLKNMALFRKDISQQSINIFLKSALTLHHTPRGKQILTVFKADHIMRGNASELEKVRKLYKYYLSLKNQKG